MATGPGPPGGRGRDDAEPPEWVRPMPREPSDPQGVPRRPPHDQTDPRGRRLPRDPTDPRGQRPARERTDPRGQREAAGPPRVLPMVPTLVIGAALVLLAFVLGNVTSGGGGDEASVTAATVASTTTTTRVVKHTVARGESLLGIASRYGVTAEALAAANGITNQNHVFVGQVLTIPPTTAVAPAPTTTTTVEIPTGK